MGYTMHVIAPHHMAGDDPNSPNCPMNYCDLYKDPWYNDLKDTMHQVWNCWIDGTLNDGTRLTPYLSMTLVHCPWDHDLRDEMNAFFEHSKVDQRSKDEVVRYLDWIDYWKKKGAQFYLSM